MSVATTKWTHLAPRPNSAYSQLFVKGTRIRARVLYGWYACEEPRSPEEIAADYDLPVEAVKEAIAYCESNPPEMLQDYVVEERLMAATGMNDPAYKYHGNPPILPPQERARIERS